MFALLRDSNLLQKKKRELYVLLSKIIRLIDKKRKVLPKRSHL